jgi:transposase InsO family protein
MSPAVRDAAVIDALQGLVADHARWGFRQCFDRLRLDGQPWNHKRVLRVYRGLRLNLPRRTRRRVPPRFRQPLAAPTRINEVWALDFVHDAFTDWCQQHGIGLLYIQPGKPVQNAFIERFNRTYREEVLDAYLSHDARGAAALRCVARRLQRAPAP